MEKFLPVSPAGVTQKLRDGFYGLPKFFQDARSKLIPASIATLAALRFDCPHDPCTSQIVKSNPRAIYFAASPNVTKKQRRNQGFKLDEETRYCLTGGHARIFSRRNLRFKMRDMACQSEAVRQEHFLNVRRQSDTPQCTAPCVALRLDNFVCSGVILWQGVRRSIPFDTAFDTASRFWVSNGIKWQHGARACQCRLCDGIRRNHDTSRNRKCVGKLRVNCSTN
jgi:hypothetical protein